jgi:hypothetical protein
VPGWLLPHQVSGLFLAITHRMKSCECIDRVTLNEAMMLMMREWPGPLVAYLATSRSSSSKVAVILVEAFTCAAIAEKVDRGVPKRLIEASLALGPSCLVCG